MCNGSPCQLPDLSDVSERCCHHNCVVLVLLIVLVNTLDRLHSRVLHIRTTSSDQHCKTIQTSNNDSSDVSQDAAACMHHCIRKWNKADLMGSKLSAFLLLVPVHDATHKGRNETGPSISTCSCLHSGICYISCLMFTAFM